MKNLFQRDEKKGVSLMVGYVLLIALAIGLSIGVFFYLKLYLPSEKPKCPEDVSISIDQLGCRLGGSFVNIDINLTNRGFFTIDDGFVKIGDEGRVFRTTINLLNNGVTDRFVSDVSICNQDIGLEPDERYCRTLIYNVNTANLGVQEVSVEPLVYVDNTPVLCSNSIAKKKIICS